MSMTPAGRPCTFCETGSLQAGFFEDRGEGSSGYVSWIAGQLERGLLGGAKRMGRQRLAVEAWRCGSCGHLELFANRS